MRYRHENWLSSSWQATVALVGRSFPVSFFEVGTRVLSTGVRIFDLRNFAFEPVGLINVRPIIQYHPILGFVHRPNMRFGRAPGGIEATGPLGNRLTKLLDEKEAIPPASRDAILALGDSFTFGSEVGPGESWPAFLESMLGSPVINAGQGGYGVGQICPQRRAADTSGGSAGRYRVLYRR
jgi:hypothetical protein